MTLETQMWIRLSKCVIAAYYGTLAEGFLVATANKYLLDEE